VVIARLCLLSLLILGVLAAPAAAAAGDRPLERRLERSLRDVVNGPGGPPGASALLRHRGKEKFITVGVADVDSGRPFRRNQHMRIASTSKAFSGAVALSLVDQGVLALNDTIAEHLPSLTKWGTVTLRQLLGHTGGVPSYTKDPGFLTYFVEHIQDTDVTKEQLVAFVADEDLEFTPGTSYEYSNTDNIVIAMMAEAATGMTYNELLAEEVFDPLGLRETGLRNDSILPGPKIRGYDVSPIDDLTSCCSMAFVSASGGLYSTPHELTRFTRRYVGGALFGGAVRRKQFQFVPGGRSEPPGPGPNAAGLAVFRYRTNCGTVFGHTGNFPGYTQFTASTKNGKRSVTVSANRQLDPAAPGVDAPEAFIRLRSSFRSAVCAALAGRQG
jgi:D-alanyl-D-alanine carboxypeptidase